MVRKKIYFLINSLEGGWAERTIVNISERLSKSNDVTIITLKDVNFYDLPEKVTYMPLSHIKNNIWMVLLFPWYVHRFKKLLKKHTFDAGMSSLEVANFVNILANKNARIAFETSMWFFTGIIWFFYKTLIKILYPRAQKIKVNSEENKYDLAWYLLIGQERVSVIYNPINLEKIEQLKIEAISEELLQKIQWKKVFITVGRLIKSKFHSKIIYSFKKVYDEIDDGWVYFIVGDGSEKESLEQQVKNLWLQNNIIFLWAQKNVFKYLNIADYFVYASKIEWFPNVLGEAMACNLPIITSDFKTGAKECIFWEYNENICKNINYPYYWANGALLNLERYEEDFFEVYKNLDKVQQERKWFEKFQLENIERDVFQFIF